jgi:Glycosyltransferase family 87
MSLRKPDLHLLVFSISAVVLFALGAARVFRASNDFVPVYTGARCLLHGCNPYDTSQLEQQFFLAGGRAAELPSWNIDVPVYPPSTFLVLSPLALFPFPAARLIWFLLNGCLFVVATGLILAMCPPSHRWLATALGSLFLLSSAILLVLGQPAIFAISLLAIAIYLFLRGRLLSLGTLLLILSLAVKPQVGGLIVVYLIARRLHWRSAVVALAGALALLLSSALILQLHPRSVGWAPTLRENLTATLDTGGSADPRPTNPQAIGDTNLQALTSIFFTDARIFNAVAYAVFAVLLAAGIMANLRPNASPQLHFLALGALSVLSLTPVYHRFYDTRLLLLTLPAILIVFEKRRLLGVFILVLSVLSVISVQYRIQILLQQHDRWQSVLQNKLLFILLLRQQNLELMILFCLYLYAILSTRFTSPPAIEPALAYPAAVTPHLIR